MEEMENDEMDSLFEGMVLFSDTPPSQANVVAPPPPPPDHADDDFENQENQPISAVQVESSIATRTTTPSSASQPLDENLFSDLTLVTSSTDHLFENETPPPPQSSVHYSSSPSPSPSRPLPRPLFTSDDIATTSTSTTTTTSCSSSMQVATPTQIQPSLLSRQLSTTTTRKKKRAGGLRIGYARDSPHHFTSDSPPLPPSPSPSSAFVNPDSNGLPDSTHSSATMTTATTATTMVGLPAVRDHTIDDTPSAPIITDRSPNTVGAPVPNAEPSTAFPAVDIHQQEDDPIVQGQTNSTSPPSSSTSPIELRFDHIKAQISQKLNHAREVVASLSATRKDSIRKRRKAAEDLTLASTMYKELEKELEEACEAEDFETAERVSDTLASAEKTKELLSTALRDAELDCDAVDFKMQEALASQIAAEEECATMLASFAMDAARDADSVQTSAELATSKEMDKWFSSAESLEVKKIELEIESHFVSEARHELNDSIQNSTKDDRGEREFLLKKKEMLREELEKLLALVKQKEAEIAENDSSIEGVEKKITDAASSFQELQSNIHSKFNILRSSLSQIELDYEALSRKKKEIDDFRSQEEDRVSKIRELARITTNEVSVCQEVIDLRKSLMQFISKSLEDKVRLAKTGEKLSVDLQLLKQDITAERASLQDLSSTKSRFQQAIESYKQSLLFIDKRAPELEAEKRVAATARNFKEAARIATEVKALYVDKESVQIKMEEATSELKRLEIDISSAVDRLEDLEQQMSLKEKDLAMARYQRLLLVAAAANAERSAALQLGDVEEANILLGEAQAADFEAKKLQPIYSFKEEEFENISKHMFISMELVSSLGRNQLEELAASANICTL